MFIAPFAGAMSGRISPKRILSIGLTLQAIEPLLRSRSRAFAASAGPRQRRLLRWRTPPDTTTAARGRDAECVATPATAASLGMWCT